MAEAKKPKIEKVNICDLREASDYLKDRTKINIMRAVMENNESLNNGCIISNDYIEDYACDDYEEADQDLKEACKLLLEEFPNVNYWHIWW
jgi:hypothetical protein